MLGVAKSENGSLHRVLRQTERDQNVVMFGAEPLHVGFAWDGKNHRVSAGIRTLLVVGIAFAELHFSILVEAGAYAPALRDLTSYHLSSLRT